MVGDGKSAVEAVVSCNRQLMDVRREMEELRDGGGEQDELDNWLSYMSSCRCWIPIQQSWRHPKSSKV